MIIETDLWDRIRARFSMVEMHSPRVQSFEQYYATRQDYVKRFVARGSRYLYHIVNEVERRGMPSEIALLPIIESAFNPQAMSSARASGMWQFMPGTGDNYGLKQNWHADNRRDVVLSTTAALDYLQKLHGMFGAWELAIAAYNCGQGCVARAILNNQRRGLSSDFASLDLPNETRQYVPKLLAVKNIVLSPASYGVELAPVSNRPYFIAVDAPRKIDMKLAAKLAEMPEDEFAALNPAFNRPVASSGRGSFLVPTESADTFRSNLELYKSLNGPMVSWQSAGARKGESVDAVARRYGMTASYLRATSGPFAERKGKFVQPATFMVPNQQHARLMHATFEKKVAIKNGDLPMPTITNAAYSESGNTRKHRVVKGDTLHSIAARVGSTPDEIRALNGIEGSALKIGQSLIVPPGDTEVAAEIAAPARGSPASRSTQYTVRSGDTLSGIANKLNVSVDDLLRWNRLRKTSTLAIGYRLKVSA
jgi:membrane-bound lytic murein transglycosylase D